VGFEPVTLFAALSVVTKHLGFIATASTTYEEPYTLARKFASLDHLSKGRAGWNLVTSAGDATARNFGLDRQRPPARTLRARQRVRRYRHRAVGQLGGRRLHPRQGERPVLRPGQGPRAAPQGQAFLGGRRPQRGAAAPGLPVIVQAGQSEPGRELAARTAEVVFTAHQNLPTPRPSTAT
jgi:alkanesulfonate monooxygenase SsuD/methylene tetrahydromethanopterin reductase-like flavin-dependent oxidoreductase (luciferase family)